MRITLNIRVNYKLIKTLCRNNTKNLGNDFIFYLIPSSLLKPKSEPLAILTNEDPMSVLGPRCVMVRDKPFIRDGVKV